MGKKLKTTKICLECKNPFKASPFSKTSICPTCIAIKKGLDLQQAAKDLKEGIKETSTRFEFEFTEKGQKLSAVRSQGEAFASKGGVPLMITEFIENSFDAIKRKKILQVLPDVIKQMILSPEFEKIIYEKYIMPPYEFEEKYQNLSNEYKENFTKLEKKILDTIKSKKVEKEFIVLKLDDEHERVIISDSGTGIEHPIHICTKPLISLKTGENNLQITGKFGRGCQVFREFLGVMGFYSLRNKIISNREIEHITNKKNFQPTDEKAKSIHITFPHDDPAGYLDYCEVTEYKNLSSNSGTGNVVVLSDWWEDNYQQLSKHISKLERRLQHHFGFGVGDIFNIGLKIIHGGKEIEILPKDYDNEPKIQGLFNLNTIQLNDDSGKPCGEIEFHIYKTTRSYSDDFKKPYLVVNGRPLGDSSLSEMPNLSQVKEIWESSFITGYVICNSVEPNQMRTGLKYTPSRLPFFNAINGISIDLKRLNSEWKNELSSARDVELKNEVIQKVTQFLSKKGIKFNFKNPLQKGIQEDLKNSGMEISDDRVSPEPGDVNTGRIVNDGTEIVEVGYKPTKIKEIKPGSEEDVIVVPHGGRKKDGDKIIKVKVKRSLVSKGGRRIRNSFTGPDLDFDDDEDCENKLSFFESEPPTVFIETEHPAWKKLAQKARDQSNAEKYEQEKMNYLIERYLWEIMNNKSVNADAEISDEDRRDLFWTYFHEIIDVK